jgi:DNA polymerase III epsilon subunit-like protein
MFVTLVAVKSSVAGELLVSVDIEASGPSPSVASLLSIGACLVDRPEMGLYVELRPLADKQWDEDAARVHGLSRELLERDGLEPAAAMEQVEAWLLEVSAGARPVFVGFNAPFDWMFVADYFWRYRGRNPFGISALDLKSYFMGSEKVARWEETRRVYVDERLGLVPDHSHQALEDARGQAVLARILLGRPAVTSTES